MSEEYRSPEDYAVDKILDLLNGMDGMTNCMAFGILECVKQEIAENIHTDNHGHLEY